MLCVQQKLTEMKESSALNEEMTKRVLGEEGAIPAEQREQSEEARAKKQVSIQIPSTPPSTPVGSLDGQLQGGSSGET